MPLYPRLNGDTAAYILEHSESRLLSIGKMDEWFGQRKRIIREF